MLTIASLKRRFLSSCFMKTKMRFIYFDCILCYTVQEIVCNSYILTACSIWFVLTLLAFFLFFFGLKKQFSS